MATHPLSLVGTPAHLYSSGRAVADIRDITYKHHELNPYTVVKKHVYFKYTKPRQITKITGTFFICSYSRLSKCASCTVTALFICSYSWLSKCASCTVTVQQRPEHFCLWSSFDLQSPMFITLFAIGSMAFLCLMYSGVQHKILLNCLPLGELVENKDSSTVTLNNSKSVVEVQGVHISQTVST